MAIFDKAYTKLAEVEGGWAHHKADPGGATNFGISLRFLQDLEDFDGDGWLDGDLDRDGDVDIDDIRELDPQRAKDFYFDRFWTRYKYPLINDQRVADKVLSFSVHMGPGRAHKLLQAAIAYQQPIKVDGIAGNKTLTLVNNVEQEALLVELKHEAADFYRKLIQSKPSLDVFRRGWLKRAYSE